MAAKRVIANLTVVAFLACCASAHAGQVPNPINAPATIGSGDAYISTGTNPQQAADAGSPPLLTSQVSSGLSFSGSLLHIPSSGVTNAMLVNSATTVNGQTCTLGSSCTATAVASAVVVGTTSVTSGTSPYLLYNNSGVLGNEAVSSLSIAWSQLTSIPTATASTLGISSPDNVTMKATAGVYAVQYPTSGSLMLSAGNGAVPTAYAGSAASACSNQFTTNTSTSAAGVVTNTCTTDVLASAQHANQGTTTTLLHGNASGNPSWAAVANADLTNSSMTIAGHSVSLGGTQAIACGDLSNGATGCSTATGTSGATIPLLNGANTWSGVQSINSGDLKLKGATSGTIELDAAATAGTSVITLPGGTTDFSATGGTSQVVKQTSSGGAFTVARLACADLSDSSTGCSSAVNLGTVTSVATNNGLTGGTITSTGTIGLASIANNAALCNNSGSSAVPTTANCAVTGTGNLVLAISPSISSLTVTSAFTATGLVTNADLANAATTVNGQTCTLGSSCTISASAGTITVGVTTIASGTNGYIEYNNSGTLGEKAVTGTGSVVLAAAPTITGTLNTANQTITSASANALAVGPNGTTNPAFNVNASTASSVTGLNIKSAAATGGLALSVLSSGSNENLTIDAKGSGTIVLGGTSTGAITLTRATTLSAALTYGGVTLSNAVTGTGNMVLATSPSVSSLTVTSAFTATGLVTNADLANSSVTLGSTAMSLGSTYATIAGAITWSGGQTFSAAMTYGGVTLSNSVSGTGSMALTASPNFTGSPTFNSIYKISSGQFVNVGTAQTVSLSLGSAGKILIYAYQNGIGTYTAEYNYLYRAGGAADISSAIWSDGDAVLSSVTVTGGGGGGGHITITPAAANTNIDYEITALN